ncbi:hypothetical protein [Saccharibacillus sacchari]|uniref:hypothetical protein n=1 Tax=Saccharibacillus sacchari TaxID=456493 RepID=UPI0004B9DCC9|nr:hypothetical protein [Saccharibacillus sacchari]
MYKVLALALVVLAWAGTDIVMTTPSIEVNVTNATGHHGASISEWQGDDTVITDEYGNQSTLGELKSYTSVVLP